MLLLTQSHPSDLNGGIVGFTFWDFIPSSDFKIAFSCEAWSGKIHSSKNTFSSFEFLLEMQMQD